MAQSTTTRQLKTPSDRSSSNPNHCASCASQIIRFSRKQIKYCSKSPQPYRPRPHLFRPPQTPHSPQANVDGREAKKETWQPPYLFNLILLLKLNDAQFPG